MARYRLVDTAWSGWAMRAHWQWDWCRPDDGRDEWWFCLGPLALIWERS